MENFRGYTVKNRKGLSHWNALLEEWLLVVERYCRVMQGNDAPFYYTERACVGTLAAAAWRCGSIALEEFQLEKSESALGKWLGRADLYMASDDAEEFIEAKQKWVSLKFRKELDAHIQETLSLAVQDARNTRNDSPQGAQSLNEKGASSPSKYIGVAFIPLYVPDTQKDQLDDLIRNAIEAAHATKYHALAWCFPPEVRNYTNHYHNFLPGVLLVAKNIQFD